MMKSTGIVRKVDELGRVVIPIELRRTLGIGEKDALEIFVDGERIVLKKYEPACIFSGNAENLIYYRGKMISEECVRELAALLENKTVRSCHSTKRSLLQAMILVIYFAFWDLSFFCHFFDRFFRGQPFFHPQLNMRRYT